MTTLGDISKAIDLITASVDEIIEHRVDVVTESDWMREIITQIVRQEIHNTLYEKGDLKRLIKIEVKNQKGVT